MKKEFKRRKKTADQTTQPHHKASNSWQEHLRSTHSPKLNVAIERVSKKEFDANPKKLYMSALRELIYHMDIPDIETLFDCETRDSFGYVELRMKIKKQ